MKDHDHIKQHTDELNNRVRGLIVENVDEHTPVALTYLAANLDKYKFLYNHLKLVYDIHTSIRYDVETKFPNVCGKQISKYLNRNGIYDMKMSTIKIPFLISASICTAIFSAIVYYGVSNLLAADYVLFCIFTLIMCSAATIILMHMISPFFPKLKMYRINMKRIRDDVNIT